MSGTIGPVAIGTRLPAAFLPTPVSGADTRAEETAREIDLEVKRLMTDAYAVALSVLGEHGAALSEIGRRLLDREVAHGDEVRNLVSSPSEEPIPA